jgi:hypothetical protein
MPDWALLLSRKEVPVDDTSSKMQDPARRVERYRKAAAEYLELAGGAPTPFLRAYYQRVAEEYRKHAEDELRVVKQDGSSVREPATKS